MKIVYKSIPETANLDELERKISLENILIDTRDLMPEDIPQRNEETLEQTLIGIDMETITYRKELEEKLRENPISKVDAEKTINWAFSGNQGCYSLAERDTGYSIRELISIANSEVTYKESDVEVISESRSSVPPDDEKSDDELLGRSPLGPLRGCNSSSLFLYIITTTSLNGVLSQR